nr:uncharacterized protein LOC116151039 [Camelus dromedarius]
MRLPSCAAQTALAGSVPHPAPLHLPGGGSGGDCKRRPRLQAALLFRELSQEHLAPTWLPHTLRGFRCQPVCVCAHARPRPPRPAGIGDFWLELLLYGKWRLGPGGPGWGPAVGRWAGTPPFCRPTLLRAYPPARHTAARHSPDLHPQCPHTATNGVLALKATTALGRATPPAPLPLLASPFPILSSHPGQAQSLTRPRRWGSFSSHRGP